MRQFVLAMLMFVGTTLQAETLRLAVTTSFNNSGLSDILLPAIKADTGLDVDLLIVGTGQALRLGEAGDVDAILVHSKPAEEAFVAAGHGTHRREIMYNDFVLVGPRADPAGSAAAKDAAAAFRAILDDKAAFVSRGDNSGTHAKELEIWQSAGLDAAQFDDWYKSVGASMGASLNTAAGFDAYILADRASWINFGNKAGLTLLFAGDPALFNQYAYIPVNPGLHSHVKSEAAQALETWLTSDAARDLINSYQIGGQQLFHFNAQPLDPQ